MEFFALGFSIFLVAKKYTSMPALATTNPRIFHFTPTLRAIKINTAAANPREPEDMLA